jgi:hippurate hydrolase
MAVWVGVARALVAMKEAWQGRLVFVAQPAEEIASGAKAMIDDGFIARFGKPDYGFALHVSPAEAGTVAYKGGTLTSNADMLEITFNGVGGHGSMPSYTIDPIVMAAHFTMDVQSVVSREKDPLAFGVVSIGSIHGDSAHNVIPACCQLHGTIRSFDGAVSEKMHAGIRRTTIAVADMSGAPAGSLAFERRSAAGLCFAPSPTG